jgi:hypothetical protein
MCIPLSLLVICNFYTKTLTGNNILIWIWEPSTHNLNKIHFILFKCMQKNTWNIFQLCDKNQYEQHQTFAQRGVRNFIPAKPSSELRRGKEIGALDEDAAYICQPTYCVSAKLQEAKLCSRFGFCIKTADVIRQQNISVGKREKCIEQKVILFKLQLTKRVCKDVFHWSQHSPKEKFFWKCSHLRDFIVHLLLP